MRLRAIAAALVGLGTIPSPAVAHTLFPGSQTVVTYGDRAFVRLEAANARKDVSSFIVEVFQGATWTPSKVAVATPQRLTVKAREASSAESTNQTITLLVDLNGEDEQKLRVCTKTATPQTQLLPQTTQVNTRVCANVTVRKKK